MPENEMPESDAENFPPAYITTPPAPVLVPFFTDADVPPILRGSTTATLYQGDCLRVLPALPAGTFDAIITDPPYCSGGMTNAERRKGAASKYILKQAGTTEATLRRPDFSGDSRDQRSFGQWILNVLLEAFRVAKTDAMLAVFCDWRQIPVVSDSIQGAGWIWKNVFVWDKTEATRPNMGWFRQQCEFVCLATKGAGTANKDQCSPGLWRGGRHAEDRVHITGKPVALMRQLLSPLPTGATILDPFAGSGSTLLAARASGMNSIGIEFTDAYAAIAAKRLRGEVVQVGDTGAEDAGTDDLPLFADAPPHTPIDPEDYIVAP
jgi:site-specific DNA-methyltransferase (adenine-specific)